MSNKWLHNNSLTLYPGNFCWLWTGKFKWYSQKYKDPRVQYKKHHTSETSQYTTNGIFILLQKLIFPNLPWIKPPSESIIDLWNISDTVSTTFLPVSFFFHHARRITAWKCSCMQLIAQLFFFWSIFTSHLDTPSAYQLVDNACESCISWWHFLTCSCRGVLKWIKRSAKSIYIIRYSSIYLLKNIY